MSEDIVLPFDLPSVCRKKLSVGFDGGMLSSDAGVLLLRGVERRLGIAARLAACLKDRRDPELIEHTVEEMLRLRMFAIAAGYEDADDCDSLRHDPIFKMAVGRLPGTGEPLCSQPTMSRLENAPSKTGIARVMAAMVDQFCASYRRAPASITLDIDDTFDAVHGHQQLSLFNAHYDERCFLPIHIYEGGSGKPVAVILREGKTPAGVEVRTILKHVIGHIRRHWPKVRILVRGDSHYGRVEAMEWCEEQGVDYIFGFGGNAVLKAMTQEAADALCVGRAQGRGEAAQLRHAELRRQELEQGAPHRRPHRGDAEGPRHPLRRHLAQGHGKASLRDRLLRPRPGGELHQVAQGPARLRPHLVPRSQGQPVPADPAHRRLLAHAHRAQCDRKALPARVAEFATLRLRLIKIAARVIEGAARIRVFLPTACPDRAVFRDLAGGSAQQDLERRGGVAAPALRRNLQPEKLNHRSSRRQHPTRSQRRASR